MIDSIQAQLMVEGVNYIWRLWDAVEQNFKELGESAHRWPTDGNSFGEVMKHLADNPDWQVQLNGYRVCLLHIAKTLEALGFQRWRIPSENPPEPQPF